MKVFGKSTIRISWFVFVLGFVASYAQDKSAITITFPISSTVWETKEPAELQWKTQNIDTSKSIRFFLLRNKTVVQELGRFKNSGGVQGIKLAKNVGSGDNYQVMAIELFPNNKEQIAKYASPFFSIRNKESDLRKKQFELAKSNSTPAKAQKRNTRKQPISNPPLPKEFEGRRISYVKNLTFDSERLKVKVWDHQEEDGDIVSIYLNGDLVLSKHLLTNDHQEFDIELNSEKPNDFLLYAHNLGEVSPNTVSVEITSDKKSETMTLNSYLRSCEAVLISVKK
nr:hypothetical protein [uncultured Allomuricauda sp.]